MARIFRDPPVDPGNVIDARCLVCPEGWLGLPFMISDGTNEIQLRICHKCQVRFKKSGEIDSKTVHGMLEKMLDRGMISEYEWEPDSDGESA